MSRSLPDRPGILRLALLVCCLSLGAGSRAADGLPALHSNPEALLVKSLLEINQSRLDAALANIDHLLQANPNFRLAQLVKGDLLLARARPISTLGDAPQAPRERLEELREEARARIDRYREKDPPKGRVPRYLLQMAPQQKYAVVADTGRSRLYLFENAGGEARYVADYYITSGKNGSAKQQAGDKKTPIGVYFVTASLPRAKLSDFYGIGAFPISYPNEWDRREGHDGYGIWLHGTPSDTYSRPPRASDGCIVLSNPDLKALERNFQVGLTPVIITPRMEWITPGARRELKQELSHALEAWRRDWESRETNEYLAHYSRTFSSGKQDFAQWAQHKRRINAGKSWIKVRLSDVALFLYPGRHDLAVVEFEQHYSSSNLSNRMKKRQYWIKEEGRWKIVYEGAA